MKRRSFIQKAGMSTLGAFSAPYILPSGRLFAQTGARKVNHVVFCLFAGGVRNLESMQKSEGNLMPNMIPGTEPVSQDILGSITALPEAFPSPLSSFGTLFKEFRYTSGPTGHYNAHATALTGVYTSADVNIRLRPEFPTVFEYYRKHSSPAKSALNAWWVSDSLGPYPALNFSNYSGYGAQFGANFIQPTALISGQGYGALGNPKQFSATELERASMFRQFADDNFATQFQAGDAGVINEEDGILKIQAFINRMFQEAVVGEHNNPWDIPAGFMNGDMMNIFYAEKVLEEFQPELTVVNMQNVDVCHNNFSLYANNLRLADYALGHLWDYIQSNPGMSDDTILIAAPEHGRNLEANTVIDQNGRFAIDHTNTDMARQIFCLVAGPGGVVNQDNVISQLSGDSIDLLPTIANILGFDLEIPVGMLQGRVLEEAFV